jgi:hypothetical protein
MVPTHEVAADGVPPAHVAPAVPLGIVLVEEVILVPEEDEPVGVVDEVPGGVKWNDGRGPSGASAHDDEPAARHNAASE